MSARGVVGLPGRRRHPPTHGAPDDRLRHGGRSKRPPAPTTSFRLGRGVIQMPRFPIMPWRVGDFLAETAHLTAAENGVYAIFLMRMWSRGGSVPDDDRDNSRLFNLPIGVYRTIKARLIQEQKLISEDGKLTNKRLLTEIRNAILKSETAKIGAAKRRAKSPENNDLADLYVPPTYPTTYPQRYLKKKKKKKKKERTKEKEKEKEEERRSRLFDDLTEKSSHENLPEKSSGEKALDQKALDQIEANWDAFKLVYPRRQGGQVWTTAKKRFFGCVDRGCSGKDIIQAARIIQPNKRRPAISELAT